MSKDISSSACEGTKKCNPAKEKKITEYRFDVSVKIHPEQIPMLNELRSDLSNLSKRNVSICATIRYMISLADSFRKKNPKWLENTELVFGVLKKNSSKIW